MDKKTLKEYAELMKEYHLSSLEIEEDGCKVKLERHPKPPKGHHGGMPPMGPPMMGRGPEPGRPPYGMPPAQAPYGAEVQASESAVQQTAPRAKGETITSPMVGVFYQASAENAEPYVKIGDNVKKGDTLCIIEAMKLMNEITAERDGKITDILVENGAVVEYGTPLFVIE